MPRLAPGESRAFSFAGIGWSRRNFLGSIRLPMVRRAYWRRLLNFLLSIYSAVFCCFSHETRQFQKVFRLTLLQMRRQDATDFAPAN
jgi:hypothetical protein